MGNTSSAPQITAQDRAILRMKNQRDKLREYQKRIQVVLDREHEIAKECLARGDKSKALLALRRRKYQESLLGKTDSQLETLEQLASTVEFSLVEKDVLFGLRQGNEVLRAIQKEMSLESVEKLLDDTAEALRYQHDVSSMLASSMTNAEQYEVDGELERIERELRYDLHVGVEELPSVPPAAPLPNTLAEEKGLNKQALEHTRKLPETEPEAILS